MLGGRLFLQAEQLAVARFQFVVPRLGIGHQFFEPRPERLQNGKLIEMVASDAILLLDPLTDGWVVDFFQPTIIVDNLHPVVGFSYRPLGSAGQCDWLGPASLR